VELDPETMADLAVVNRRITERAAAQPQAQTAPLAADSVTRSASASASASDDFTLRVLERMRRRAEAEADHGSCDYNDPRRTSISELREREDQFVEIEPPGTFRERYSANGFSGTTQQQDEEAYGR
jgi:hypothetical protein